MSLVEYLDSDVASVALKVPDGVEILRLGKIPKERKYGMECHHCGTVLVVKESACYQNTIRSHIYVDCPLCTKVIMKEKEDYLPSEV